MPVLLRVLLLVVGAACVWKVADSLSDAASRAAELAGTIYTPFLLLSSAILILALVYALGRFTRKP